jgi:hypothetical protein
MNTILVFVLDTNVTVVGLVANVLSRKASNFSATQTDAVAVILHTVITFSLFARCAPTGGSELVIELKLI